MNPTARQVKADAKKYRYKSAWARNSPCMVDWARKLGIYDECVAHTMGRKPPGPKREIRPYLILAEEW